MSKYRVTSVYVVAAVLVVAAAVWIFVHPSAPMTDHISPIPGVTVKNFPTVDGAQSTLSLSGLLLARAMRVPAELRRLPSRAPWLTVTFPRSLDTDNVRAYTDASQRLHAQGTRAAYQALLTAGTKTRLILVTREPSDAEQKQAETQGFGLDAQPIALDALVIVANAQNPVQALSMDEVSRIFTDQLTNWKAVTGPDAKINVFLGDQDSDTLDFMIRQVLQGGQPAPHDSRLERMTADVRDRVMQDPDAISFSSFTYEGTIAPTEKVRAMTIEGVPPTAATIADGSYPLGMPIYVVIRDDAKLDSPERKLRDWLKSENGQYLIRDCGFIPLMAAKNR